MKKRKMNKKKVSFIEFIQAIAIFWVPLLGMYLAAILEPIVIKIIH